MPCWFIALPRLGEEIHGNEMSKSGGGGIDLIFRDVEDC